MGIGVGAGNKPCTIEPKNTQVTNQQKHKAREANAATLWGNAIAGSTAAPHADARQRNTQRCLGSHIDPVEVTVEKEEEGRGEEEGGRGGVRGGSGGVAAATSANHLPGGEVTAASGNWQTYGSITML